MPPIVTPIILGLLVLGLSGGDLLLHQLGPLLQHGVDPAEEELAQDEVEHQQVEYGKENGGGAEFQHWGRPL